MPPVIPRKNNALLYAAGDVLAWVGLPNVGCPVSFEDPTAITAGTYLCGGWVDTSGYIFKLDETIKDIPAAGSLTPIRTILTGGTKSIQATFLEALNPVVRALYDDVPVFPMASSPLLPLAGPSAPVAPVPTTSASGGTVLAGTYQVEVTYVTATGETNASPPGSIVTTGSTSTITVPSPTASTGATGWYAYVTQAGGSSFTRQQTAGSPTAIGTPLTITAPPTSTGASAPTISTAANIAKYVIPDPPADNRYSCIFDSIDGVKAQRLYAPNVKVTARGSDQVQQADVTMTDLTFTMYPGTINDGVTTVTGVGKRFINYGQSVSNYFPSGYSIEPSEVIYGEQGALGSGPTNYGLGEGENPRAGDKASASKSGR